MQPTASKLDNLLFACNIRMEKFWQQYFLLCPQLDPSLREDVLESLFQEQQDIYVYIYTLKKLLRFISWELFSPGFVLIQNSFLTYLRGFPHTQKRRTAGNLPLE